MQRPTPPVSLPLASPRLRTNLNTIVQGINVMRDLTPDFAKGVLSALSGVLTLGQKSLTNSDDMGDVGQRCYRVSLMIWRGLQNGSISEALTETLTELQRFIEGIQADIEERGKRNVVNKVVSATIDGETIAGWKEGLDHFINILNAELGMDTNVKMEQLITMFQDFLRTQQVSRTPDSDKTLVSPPPPAKPPTFFGREAMVADTVAAVIRGKHVALIGPGGIGKSSIAKAVLHERDIISKFGARRYFATYDGIPSSMMSHSTFLTCLAEALNLSTHRVTTRNIMSNLGSYKALIVLDNAETFLDASHDDSGHIAEIIAEIGAQPTITIILTTRSRSLPGNLPWLSFVVTGLGENASRLAFSTVYGHMVQNKLDSVFQSLDYHALSINLLARTALQNNWSIEDLEARWHTKKIRILEAGKGRFGSLANTVELSIQSPILVKSLNTVLLILRAIAFLPEGVHSTGISLMLIQHSEVEAIVDLLCQCSLIYRVSNRLTMLAPIRMYIMDRYNGHLIYQDPLLGSIRNYHTEMLLADSKTSAQQESMNIEHLFLFDLASSYLKLTRSWKHRLATLRLISVYLDITPTVFQRHERNLLPALIAVSEDQPLLGARSFNLGHRQNREIILAKAKCLVQLYELENALHYLNEALSVLIVAENFCSKHIHICEDNMWYCLWQQGWAYYLLGYPSLAEDAIWKAMAITKYLGDKSILNMALSHVMLSRGNLTEAARLATSAQNYLESFGDHPKWIESYTLQATICVYQGEYNTACLFAERALQYDKEKNESKCYTDLLLLKASCNASAGDITAAVHTLEVVPELVTVDLSDPTEFFKLQLALCGLAYYKAATGSFEEAKKILVRVESYEGHDNHSLSDTAAFIEILAGNGKRAKDILLLWLDSIGDDRQRVAVTHIALGEAALIECDIDEAQTHFGRAVSICKETGISPKFLCSHFFHWQKLPDDWCIGWTQFLCQDL